MKETAAGGLEATEFGTFVEEVEVDPRVARILFTGSQHNLCDTAVSLAALLTVDANVWWRGGDDGRKKKADIDHRAVRTRLNCSNSGDIVGAFRVFQKFCDLDLDLDEARAKGGECKEEEEVAEEEEPATLLTMSNLRLLDSAEKRGKPRVEDDDEDDDVKSDSSSSSEHSVASAESKVSEPGKSRFGFKKLINLRNTWCSNNSLHSKNMGIALKVKEEYKAVMMKCGRWSAQPKQASDEQTLMLFLSGYFSNVACRRKEGFFAVTTQQAVSIHQGSAVERDHNGWVCYHRIMQTSKKFMFMVSPVELLLPSREPTVLTKQAVPAFYLRSFLDTLLKDAVVNKTISPLPQAIVRVLGGRLASIKELEKATSSTIDCSVGAASYIRVWAPPAQIDKAVAMIHGRVEEVKQALQQETYEEAIVGSTRVVLGAGASLYSPI